jgi:tRNA pseudouridine38-40 synthase
MRLRLDLAYDGTGFAGWGIQPQLRTVQGVIEEALATILRLTTPARLIVAGRTDAGVHASGQVVHVDLPTFASFENTDGSFDLQEFENRLAGILKRDPDVVLRRASVAPEGFDARFSAMARRYEYRLQDDARAYNPLERYRSVWTPKPLDVDQMNETAASMLGLRDFGAFCRPRPGATTVRELLEFEWRRESDGVVVCHIMADAFCHSMVRSLVGACVATGNGRIQQAELEAVRDGAERTALFKVMPPHGLNLVEVIYPPDHELGARAELTRSRRDLLDDEAIA